MSTDIASGVDPLRPEQLSEFAGQPDVVRELRIVLEGAKARGEMPPHLLLAGPPGLGKTTLARIAAAETGVPLVSTAGPAVEKVGDLVALLVSLTRPSVVFIDEIHRLPKAVEETLYTAMEDGRVDVILAEGTTRARAIPMQIEPFTLVGATTKAGMLGGPFRDRFGYTGRLRPYDTDTLATIVARSAQLLGVTLTGDAAATIASRSRGTPRIANQWLRRVRDYAQGHAGPGVTVDDALARDALAAFRVDDAGLDPVDRDVLSALIRNFNGGPVGLSTLAAAVGEDTSTLEEVVEPYLMQIGLLARTPRGRVATAAAYLHLGLQVPAALVADGPDDGTQLTLETGVA